MTEFTISKRPLFRLISKDNIEEIHEGSLAILEKAGVNVKSNEAMISLKNAGCEAAVQHRIPSLSLEPTLQRSLAQSKIVGVSPSQTRMHVIAATYKTC